jgi:hypothetical protein
MASVTLYYANCYSSLKYGLTKLLMQKRDFSNLFKPTAVFVESINAKASLFKESLFYSDIMSNTDFFLLQEHLQSFFTHHFENKQAKLWILLSSFMQKEALNKKDFIYKDLKITKEHTIDFLPSVFNLLKDYELFLLFKEPYLELFKDEHVTQFYLRFLQFINLEEKKDLKGKEIMIGSLFCPSAYSLNQEKIKLYESFHFFLPYFLTPKQIEWIGKIAEISPVFIYLYKTDYEKQYETQRREYDSYLKESLAYLGVNLRKEDLQSKDSFFTSCFVSESFNDFKEEKEEIYFKITKQMGKDLSLKQSDFTIVLPLEKREISELSLIFSKESKTLSLQMLALSSFRERFLASFLNNLKNILKDLNLDSFIEFASHYWVLSALEMNLEELLSLKRDLFSLGENFEYPPFNLVDTNRDLLLSAYIDFERESFEKEGDSYVNIRVNYLLNRIERLRRSSLNEFFILLKEEMMQFIPQEQRSEYAFFYEVLEEISSFFLKEPQILYQKDEIILLIETILGNIKNVQKENSPFITGVKAGSMAHLWGSESKYIFVTGLNQGELFFEYEKFSQWDLRNKGECSSFVQLIKESQKSVAMWDFLLASENLYLSNLSTDKNAQKLTEHFLYEKLKATFSCKEWKKNDKASFFVDKLKLGLTPSLFQKEKEDKKRTKPPKREKILSVGALAHFLERPLAWFLEQKAGSSLKISSRTFYKKKEVPFFTLGADEKIEKRKQKLFTFCLEKYFEYQQLKDPLLSLKEFFERAVSQFLETLSENIWGALAIRSEYNELYLRTYASQLVKSLESYLTDLKKKGATFFTTFMKGDKEPIFSSYAQSFSSSLSFLSEDKNEILINMALEGLSYFQENEHLFIDILSSKVLKKKSLKPFLKEILGALFLTYEWKDKVNKVTISIHSLVEGGSELIAIEPTLFKEVCFELKKVIDYLDFLIKDYFSDKQEEIPFRFNEIEELLKSFLKEGGDLSFKKALEKAKEKEQSENYFFVEKIVALKEEDQEWIKELLLKRYYPLLAVLGEKENEAK